MDKIRALVTDELEEIEHVLLNIIEKSNPTLADLNDFLNGKSKRIRSIICLLYLKANNISINKNIIILLSSSELIHNASLLHDDVIDNSHTRRNLQTLFDKYGSKMSILMGDYLLSTAVKELLKLNNNQILQFFLQCTKEMSNAEITQYLKRNKNTTIDEYIQIAEGKTAALFSAILKSAAELNGLDIKEAERLGRIFGIIFQINNDLNKESAHNDKLNGVSNITDILGIEKSYVLKDNYKEEIKNIINKIPDNKYRQGIEGLINIL